MGRIEGTSRDQTMVLSYEDFIGEEDIVRVIDRFVEVCDLKKLWFGNTTEAATGKETQGTVLYVDRRKIVWYSIKG